MWFVSPGMTSCFPNSRGAQKEWITSWSGTPAVLCAPPPSDVSDRSIVLPVGITMTSAVTIASWFP